MVTADWSPLRQTIWLRRTSTVRASALIGHSCLMRDVSSKRISQIAEYTDPTHDPMIPHTIVLEPELIVFKIYNGYWYFGRPTIEELRQDLRAVSKKCRPDWDITSPEIRCAWERGEKNRFYPYGKTYAKVFGEQE